MGVQVPPFAHLFEVIMKYLVAIFLLFPIFLSAVDHSARTFEERRPVRHRVDTYDFSGIFPNLENIEIDAKRKKSVELDMTGEYPLLTHVNYEGSFGKLRGSLTGDFPLLELISVSCGSCAMDLDLRGSWQRSCEISICGLREDIVLTLPSDVGLVVHTRTKPAGKVIASEGLKKQGWFHVLSKTYQNALVDTADVVLTLTIETSEGNIILK